jgi:hypothetical protein
MKIYACPKCGSKNIHIGTMDSGVTYGITSWDYICKDCDYKGMPLIFYSEEEYKQFLKGLLKEIQHRLEKSDKEEKIDDENNINKKSTKEDQEILESIKQLIDKESIKPQEIELNEKPKWHKNRSWWIEISIAFILSGILLIFNISFVMIFNYEPYNPIYILYMIVEFFIQAIIFLAIIVIFEYFILFKFIRN